MKKEICDFWVGNFNNENEYFTFFGENVEKFYNEEEDEIEEKFISEFSKSQGVKWIDYDFMASGFENDETDFFVKFKKHSYSNEWMNEVYKRAKDSGLNEINTIAFINKGKIKKPVSVLNENFTLLYIGDIEYVI